MSSERAQREAREILLPRPVASPGSEAPAAPGRLRFVSAAELRATTPPEPDWVLDGYVASGAVTLAAGKPKSGKSTLIWALAEAVAADAPTFLGRRVTGGPVVFVSEEGAGTLVHKLPRTDRIRVLTRDAAWPKPAWSTLVAEAVAEAERVEAALLVIDALSFWAGFGEGQEKDASAAQVVMDALGAATGAGLAVLVVHHQRKAGGEDGDAVRGSGAIFGAIDVLVELERPGGEDAPAGHRRLVATGRLPRTPPVLVVDRDAATGSWRVVGEALDRGAAADLGLRDRLLAAAPAEAPGATEGELAELLGVDGRKISGPLRALLGDGLLARVGPGKPHHPYRYFRAPGETLPANSPQTPPSAGGESPSRTLPLPLRGGRGESRLLPDSPLGGSDDERAERLAASYPDEAAGPTTRDEDAAS